MPKQSRRAQVRSPTFTVLIGTGILCCTGLAAVDAWASGGVRYATSQNPFTQVGVLNPELSAACRKRVFNQRTPLRLSIGYLGENGRGITGIAMQGYNLYDPQRLSVPRVTYHFKNDGYSTCQVFIAEPRR